MAANDAEIPTVDDVRRDPAAVLTRFRDESSFAFSFGDDGKPEAVLLTFDEYEDLSGLDKFAATGEPLTPDAISLQLPAIVESIRAGSFTAPILWSDSTEPAAVIMSPQQYRHLRGDDEPPAGQVDDPTIRTYNTKPLSTSRAMTLDEFAAMMGPETERVLEEIRREDDERK
jgi:PHD/YefM family antitoxin component YafN of YafNO toxin-antitoxin module